MLSGLVRFKVAVKWYLAAAVLFLAPLAITLIYDLLGGAHPGLVPSRTAASLAGIVLFTFFSGPFSEALGWRGFALPRLEARYNALVSSLILGVIWTCWHIPLYFIAGTSQLGIPFPFYLLLVVTVAVYLTWLYNNTRGSLAITVLAHFSYNLTGFLNGPLGLIPPMVFYITAGPLLGLLVIGIVLLFKPRLLSRKPLAEMPFEKTAAS